MEPFEDFSTPAEEAKKQEDEAPVTESVKEGKSPKDNSSAEDDPDEKKESAREPKEEEERPPAEGAPTERQLKTDEIPADEPKEEDAKDAQLESEKQEENPRKIHLLRNQRRSTLLERNTSKMPSNQRKMPLKNLQKTQRRRSKTVSPSKHSPVEEAQDTTSEESPKGKAKKSL